ncbi:MAG: [Thermoguttaceae bacterium]|nr:[FeFe] hydrogenase H-cluster radical SAM maturase HydE [Thermoguttaceae bacterium]
MLNSKIDEAEIANWLRETDEEKLAELFHAADRLRRDRVGDAVWFRGLLEISNYCRRNCLYCGVRASRTIARYRMTREEILDGASFAASRGFGTLVLQAGEDLALDADFVAELVAEIKGRFELAITLSLGERSDSEWELWKRAGADRYLLRFETSNPELYRAIHPSADENEPADRIALLKRLREIGYEIGSGVMIGIPGQTFRDLARDLALFRELDLDMIGCGAYIPHRSTPLGRLEKRDGLWKTIPLPDDAPKSEREIPLPSNKQFVYPATSEQVPNDLETALKTVALARVLCPDANIPSTTALATLDAKRGRKGGLERGANVVMPNLTPTKYRSLYEIYPNKSGTTESAEKTLQTALDQIAEIGRFPGKGSGASPRFLERSSGATRWR